MNPDDLAGLLREVPAMATASTSDTDALLEQLQKAADEHRRILERQSELIARLREELREVPR